MLKTRKWVVASRPEVMATPEHFRLEEEDLPELEDGEFLIDVVYLRTNPPLRMLLVSGSGLGDPIPLGGTMASNGLGRVAQSNNSDFEVGDIVTGGLAWQDQVISDGATKTPVRKLQKSNEFPVSALMTVLGSAGLTAYFGVFDYAKPKPGDTLVVSTAAGTVGSAVCQIGKLERCRVIGIAGSKRKCDWVTDELGADACIDYQSEDVHARLKELCPDGIDIYFDNVGGETLDAALDLIAQGARVVLCGASSQYTHDLDWYGPKNYFNLVYRQAQMYGFYIANFADRFDEATAYMADLISKGNMKYAEEIIEGLEQTPAALERVLRSENFGTVLVEVNKP